MPWIVEYSERAVGRVWNEADHLELVHAVHEIERTAAAMVEAFERCECNPPREPEPKKPAALEPADRRTLAAGEE